MNIMSGSLHAKFHFSLSLFRLATFSIFVCLVIPGSAFTQEVDYRLGLVGYNYTGSHISDYSVNGVGGGNVFLSSATSGGSGVTCCLRIPQSSLASLKVKIRWQSGGCRYIARNNWTKETAELTHYFYKEKQVSVIQAASSEGQYLETHFYADGSVEAHISNSISLPRVRMNADTTSKRIFPRCKNDEKPQ